MENKKFPAHVDIIFAQNGHETVKRRGKIAFADVVLGRQDHVERDHRRERRAQVLLEVIRDTQQDDGSVGGFVFKRLSSRFVEIHAAAVEEEL